MSFYKRRLCAIFVKDCMKYWEIIADNLSKAGWSLGCVLPVVVMLCENRGNMPFQKFCNALVGIDLILNF